MRDLNDEGLTTVGIFRRGTKGANATSAGTDGKQSTAGGSATESRAAEGTAPGGTGVDADGAEAARAMPSSEAMRRSGPWDRSEVEGLDGRLDLGALWVTGVAGMELRLEVEEESQNVVGVTAVLDGSAVQLQAFAAPRSEGIWEEIRTEIAASITSQGGTADKAAGPLGTELRVQMPETGADGRVVFSPVRFLGVDGPRWFLRAVLSGPAASDDSAASTLLELVRATVVVRGDEAMAPRELLALKLPAQVDGAEGAGEDLSDAGEAGADATDTASAPDNPSSFDDFKPFERGPEITEIH